MKRQKGQAVILLIFILGMISVLIGISQIKLGTLESLRGRSSAKSLQAYYAANSGIENAIKRINNGDSSDSVFTIGGCNVKVGITGTSNEKTITSIAKGCNFTRKIRVKAVKLGGFNYAIQAGNGGLEMNNQTEVEGDVYSNADIKGKNNDYAGGKCKNSSSRINGNATAVGKFDRLNLSDKGVCVDKIATGSAFLYCRIGQTAYDLISSDLINGARCPHGSHGQNTPPVLPMPEVDESGSFTSLPAGNCIADGSANPLNCAGLTNTLGNVIINGDLIISPPSNKEFFFSGPVKITGSLKFKGFSSNNKVGLTTDATSNGLFVNVIVDGRITSETGNVTFCRDNSSDCTTGTKYLLFASKYETANPNMCSDAAVDLHSNTSSILFYARKGCVSVSSGGPGDTFYGAILGQKVNLSSNVNIKYDPNLGDSTGGSGWQVNNFEEF